MPNRRQWLRDRITQNYAALTAIAFALLAAAAWFWRPAETIFDGTVISLPLAF